MSTEDSAIAHENVNFLFIHLTIVVFDPLLTRVIPDGNERGWIRQGKSGGVLQLVNFSPAAAMLVTVSASMPEFAHPSGTSAIRSCPTLLMETCMKSLKTCMTATVIIAAALLSSGCSTLSDAYDSTASTVSGWFGKGDKKAE